MRAKLWHCLLDQELQESQESPRQQILCKMKYANVIIFIKDRLCQKAINFSAASWHFNICINCFSQMIIFVFSISLDRALFSFPSRLVIFRNFFLSEDCNGLWLKFHSEKLSEIHVVYLMEKIIARQVKQSMTHSNQKDWLKTQVSKEVRLFSHLLQISTTLIHLLIPSISQYIAHWMVLFHWKVQRNTIHINAVSQKLPSY